MPNDDKTTGTTQPTVTAGAATNAASDPGLTKTFKAGKRLINPLSAFSSYTYQITLYMITPDAYDEFVKNGRRSLRIMNVKDADCGSGAYIIAQSGGINNNTTNRAPGFQYDYYIDNLVIKSACGPGSDSSSAITSSKIEFTITEPYGFSFVSNLAVAKESLEKYSKSRNFAEAANTSRQFFMLGLRFLGYDSSGNLIESTPENTFERYYDIMLTTIEFTLEGRATVYQIKAANLPNTVALNQKRGVIDQGATQLVGNTVEQILNSLMNKLNEDQRASNSREFPNTYKVVFEGPQAQAIANSKIVSKADLDKIKWPMATPTDKTAVNEKLSVQAQAGNNSNERIVAFNRDTPIIQAITQVITQSDFITNALKTVYTTDIQPDAKTEDPNQLTNKSDKRIKYFNVVASTTKGKFDTKIKDYAFDITYHIQTYETPVVTGSAYADKATPYYGPVKRYNYWWTGENSEIIRYSQKLNNSYFAVALDSNGSPIAESATGGNAQIPIQLNKRQNVPRLGKMDLGLEAQNSYTTSLLDQGNFANAIVEILGDPDFLMDINTITNPTEPFYGTDGYSVNPNMGQMFIEIKFKEAIDYDHNQGTLRINNNVLCWEYPPEVAKELDGAVSYTLKNITSTFRGGNFTQVLDCTINTLTEFGSSSTAAAGRETARDDASLGELGINTGATPTGLKKDDSEKPGTAGGDPCGPIAAPQPTNQVTTTKGVANDDAAPSNEFYTDQLGNFGGRG